MEYFSSQKSLHKQVKKWMVHNSASALLSIHQTSHIVLCQGLGISLSQKSGPDKEQIIIKTGMKK